jgi:hypothetical protein
MKTMLGASGCELYGITANPSAGSFVYFNPVAVLSCPGFWAVGLPPLRKKQEETTKESPTRIKKDFKCFICFWLKIKEPLI